MVVGAEPLAAGDPGQSGVERGLELGSDREVRDPATGGADQVVVVLGEVLGQLEVGVLVGGHDPVHDVGGDQLR